MGEYIPPPPMKATEAEMEKAGLTMAYRDFCAHLLIPLNKCRRETWYMPWKCDHERHAYEICQYKEYERRMHNKKVQDGAAAEH